MLLSRRRSRKKRKGEEGGNFLLLLPRGRIGWREKRGRGEDEEILAKRNVRGLFSPKSSKKKRTLFFLRETAPQSRFFPVVANQTLAIFAQSRDALVFSAGLPHAPPEEEEERTHLKRRRERRGREREGAAASSSSVWGATKISRF